MRKNKAKRKFRRKKSTPGPKPTGLSEPFTIRLNPKQYDKMLNVMHEYDIGAGAAVRTLLG